MEDRLYDYKKASQDMYNVLKKLKLWSKMDPGNYFDENGNNVKKPGFTDFEFLVEVVINETHNVIEKYKHLFKE